MKLLERNKSTFYYALYHGKQKLSDTQGRNTGETAITYETPVKSRGYITSGTSQSIVEQFGVDFQCDKVIYLDDVNCPITETTVLYLDSTPTTSYNTSYDYIVKKISKSLNYVVIAVTKVKVS